MSFARLSILGALLSTAAILTVPACSSSSTKGTETDSGVIVCNKPDGGCVPTGDANTGTDSANGDSTTTATDSSSGSDTSMPTTSCAIPPGTYTVTNTIAAGSTATATCPPPNSTVTVAAPVDAGPSDASVGDAGNACTITTNAATCSTTSTCSTTTSGYTTMETSGETTLNGDVSGSLTYETTGPDGGAVGSPCSYTYVWTLSGSQDSGAEQ